MAFGPEPGGKKNSPRAERVVGTKTSAYPQSRMFNTLNAWGLFALHADDLSLKNVSFTAAGKSRAHMAYFENVDGLTLRGMQVSSPENEPSWITANGLRNAHLGVNWPEVANWIEFVGAPSSQIVVPTELAVTQAKARVLNAPNSLKTVKP